MIAATTLIEPTTMRTRVSTLLPIEAKTLVPTKVVRMTTGTPSTTLNRASCAASP